MTPSAFAFFLSMAVYGKRFPNQHHLTSMLDIPSYLIATPKAGRYMCHCDGNTRRDALRLPFCS